MKKKLLLLCLVALTILWLGASVIHVTAYNHMIEKRKQEVGELVSLIEFKSVLAWGNGSLLFIIGFFLAIFWLFGIYVLIKKPRRNARSKIMSLMFSGMILMLLVVSLKVDYGTQTVVAAEETHHYCYPNAIDLLFVGDEEFFARKDQYVTFSRPAWKTVQERQYPKLQKKFLEDAGISIAFNGWIHWDSNDNEHDALYLLIEAMEDVNWVSQQVYREREIFGRNVTRRMDILIVFTGQEMNDPEYGLTMTRWGAEWFSGYLGKTVWWDAIIIQYQGADLLVETWLDCALMQHEISHLIGATSERYSGLNHCNHAKCIMRPAEVLFWTSACTWKEECLEYMLDWAEQIPCEQFPPC